MANIKKYNGSTWENTTARKYETKSEIIIPPTTIYADGTAATISLKGNTVQNGTPSPSAPVDVNGVGERTENLFDGQLQQGFYAYVTGDYTLADAYVCTHLIPCTENTTYTFRCINTGGGSKNYGYVFFDTSQNRIGSDYVNVLTEGNVVTYTATTPQNTAFLAINIAYGRYQQSVVRPSDITDFMLNSGSTAKPYEPYGYKIPISSANTTTPVYLGEVESTRKIKKLVLTGEENWKSLSYGSAYLDTITDYSRVEGNISKCSHFLTNNSVKTADDAGNGITFYNAATTYYRMYLKNITTFTTIDSLKTYLQQQYANGTPVCVWYVLSSATTGIVNEPIRKIGDYVDTVSGITIPTITGKDTFDVDTTLKPSSVSLSYTGWHDANVKEWDGSEWQ